MANFNDKFMDDEKFYLVDGKEHNDKWSRDILSFNREDRVNSPSHYTQGTQEAIDIIEEAIDAAPSVKAGMLQAQVLKYLLRMWHKDNPAEDSRKALWYLNRLVDTLS